MDKLGKFFHDNYLPRYILFGIISVKAVMCYDKLKQLVALNQTYASLMSEQSMNLSKHFKSEAELQDLLTKRILEQRAFSDNEDEFGDENKYTLTGANSYAAKAKQFKINE